MYPIPQTHQPALPLEYNAEASFRPMRSNPHPEPVIALSLRDDVVVRPKNYFSISTVLRASRSPGNYLDISKADFDLYEKAHWERRISPKLDALSVLKVEGVAEYLQDPFVLRELNEVLPLRKAAHDSKGTQAYPQLLTRLADKLQGLGELEAATRKRARAARMTASLSSGHQGEGLTFKPSLEAQAHNFQGQLYWRQGQLDAALVTLDRAIKLEPLYADPYMGQGLVYMQQGKSAEALWAYHKAIDLAPEVASSYLGLAGVHAQRDELDEALVNLNRYIGLKPQAADAYNKRAVLYQQMGRSTDAVGELTRAIELDPRNVAFYEARSHLLEQQGMFQQALADVRQVLDLQRSQKGG